jgi:uncharacterized protein YcbK (DUF882 family)
MTYFSDDELKCKHCGGLVFDEAFRELLDDIRVACGFPLPVSSGYRCPDHPIEIAKDEPGAHSSGKAVDIKISGEKSLKLVEVALKHGVKRIGVNQKGDWRQRFIHLDNELDLPNPTIWSY